MTTDRREPQVVVLGGGSWGTTVASICARRGPTVQWVRSAETAEDINTNHRNSAYLGEEVELPETLRATNDFAEAAHCADVIVMGPVGVGKTHLASALGHIACRRRRSVLVGRTDRILKRLRAARLDASYDAELRRLLRVDLLILDDWGIAPVGDLERRDLLEVIEDRHGNVIEQHHSENEQVESEESACLAATCDGVIARLQTGQIPHSKAVPEKIQQPTVAGTHLEHGEFLPGTAPRLCDRVDERRGLLPQEC